MTELRKKVTRRTLEVNPTVRRRIVIQLTPGDVIAFREEGRRTWYTAPIMRVFTAVARWNIEAARAERKALRKLSRQ
ncbi:hypothetical protein GX586_12620 [bacterium]|nr:hypothetical protein [bacterium]